MILHIDMDAFFASIEQAINPRLKGKPLIVGSRDNKMRTVVCAASYEAKTRGIDSGMPSAEAFKICPDLEFVPADQSKYIWTSEQIFEILKGYGFETVYASIDEFQMDITGTPDPRALAEKIRKQIHDTFNITASVGIAKNFLLAKLASKLNKPNGVAIITEENLIETLGRTPAKKLRGVGEKTAESLYLLGIKTCLDLYQKSPAFLEKYFGKNGLSLYVSLHSDEALKNYDEEDKPKSIGHSYTLPRASKTPGFIKGWLRLLAEMVAQRLRQNNLVAGTVHLWLNGPEIGNFGCQKTYHQATNDGFEIYHKSLQILAGTGPRMPAIRALGISCSNLSVSNYAPLFAEQRRREDLLKAMDTINNRLGEGAIYPAITILTRKMQ
ncbi:MAG: DNA polymerase IV [Candidatus Omnitrophica bacterium]|nr:DNA polymerase IV [Candidatus Omnitrophota bacterium]